ncbi:MmyB family transcriptional regulator [Nocardia takedensis]|uniref:MmyB family transcriptional regulator n=1 Tax=Nocardia takedensis TaxID=259390 RepID=UPI000314DF5C|nr:hypothetical protein [Nocardia takedensis]
MHGNKTFHRSVPGLDEAEHNYIQWIFSRHARRIVVDWESEARLAVAILRAVLGRYRNLPRARRLFHTLMSNPDFARIWRATPMHVAYGRDYPAPIRVHTPHSDEPQPCHLTLTDYDGCDNIVVAYGTHNAPVLTG